jgi:hypothetical protein
MSRVQKVFDGGHWLDIFWRRGESGGNEAYREAQYADTSGKIRYRF